MATILITGDDFAAVERVRAVAEGMGHSVLHAWTTENIIEDVSLNDVALVIAAQNTRPFSEWEICEMLRGDPTLRQDLAIVLLHSEDLDRRRLSASDFDGHLYSHLTADLLCEELVRHLGDNAAPETTDPLAHSGFDKPAPPVKTPSRSGSSGRAGAAPSPQKRSRKY